MPITAKLDEFGKPAWIALIVLGFMVFWPLGLAILVYTIWSGRMGCGYHGGGVDRWQHKMERMQRKMDWMRAKMGGGPAFAYGRHARDKSEFDQFMSERRDRPAQNEPPAQN